ncbi:DNA helicase UvrD [Candidatus Woesearchaeota archaeon]|nr:DNA helicase UvrD [Candidatus Woesearchaeota archaeon]
MKVFADLHIHSKYARACSKDSNLENLEKNSLTKGLNLLGTGDFTHPLWQTEIKQKLEEVRSGIFTLKNTKTPQVNFMLQTEISLIYSQDGKGRRVHNIILAPSLEVVDQITQTLLKFGRVDYDGRPIFKIPCPDFVEMFRKISPDIEIIPAHAWTPWFSLFGSNSGFNSIKDCFHDQTKYINAIETGLSSDPAMNWRLSQLDKINLVSFSDPHSFWPWRLGREATIFEMKENYNYNDIINAIKDHEHEDKNGLKGTIEVDPNYGKYHFDGHRNCGISFSPEQANKMNKICPKCRQPLTIGVMNRIEELADRPAGFKPKTALPYYSLLPLSEIICTVIDKKVEHKTVAEEYYKLINKFGNEFTSLIDTPEEELLSVASKEIVAAILKNRRGEIEVIPGYDGLYGIPIIDQSKTEYYLKRREEEAAKEAAKEKRLDEKKELEKGQKKGSEKEEKMKKKAVGKKEVKKEKEVQKELGSW